MTLIDADVFLEYLIFSRHIDSLKCKEVKEAVEMAKVKVNILDKIKSEIRKKMRFNSFNEAVVSFDDISKIFDKYIRESEEKI